MRSSKLTAAFCVFAALLALQATAQIDKSVVASDNLTAADTQRILFDELVRGGMRREIAALVTMDTQVVRDEPDHVQFVQTMIGGIRREVDIRFARAAPPEDLRVPIVLDDGTVALAERAEMRDTALGFETSGAVYLDDATAVFGLLDDGGREAAPWWAELLGIRTAHAQPSLTGMVMSYGDSIVGGAGNAIGVQGMTVDGVIEVARQVAADPTVDIARQVGTVADNITSAMQTASEGPRTLWQSRFETAGEVAAVLKAGYDVYGAFKKDSAARDRLQSLDDCANNPTNPLTRRAMTEDPMYRRATTEAIADARRNLTLNTGLRVASTVTNAGARIILRRGGPTSRTMAKGVSLLNKVERGMLDSVLDEDIMKNAGKGVVPCTPVCGPVYEPPPPSPELEGYPPATWRCTTASLQANYCEAEAPSQISSPPPPPPPPAIAQTCGLLRRAEFSFDFNNVEAGCGDRACEQEVERRQFQATAALLPNGVNGYNGTATGQYAASAEYELRSPLSCGSNSSASSVDGRATMEVNAYPTLDNPIAGGPDTSAMPPETSVVEILVAGEGLQSSTYSKTGCDPPQEAAHNEGSGSIGCYFYGAFMYRPGYYVVHPNDNPAEGTCTLHLMR